MAEQRVINSLISDGPEVHGEVGDDLTPVDKDALYGAMVVINGFKLLDSQFDVGKKYALIDLQVEGKGVHFAWNSQGVAIMRQLKQNQENLPFQATVQEFESKKRAGVKYPAFVGV